MKFRFKVSKNWLHELQCKWFIIWRDYYYDEDVPIFLRQTNYKWKIKYMIWKKRLDFEVYPKNMKEKDYKRYIKELTEAYYKYEESIIEYQRGYRFDHYIK